jgi:predicted nucleotidyltransferase
MAKDAVAAVITFLGAALRKSGLHVEKLVLFGSHAQGEARQDSDIDIAIVSPDFQGKDIFDRSRLVMAAELATVGKFIVPLDLVMLTPGEYESRSSPIASFAREGEVVYHS